MINHTSDLRIVSIGGSLRERSCSYMALEHVTTLLRDLGCHARIFDLRVMRLPFCNGDNTEPRPDYPGVAELRRAVANAHALILATPEYHGGVSGVLKNALDLLSAEQLAGKVVGVISVLGGAANSNALNDVARTLRSCHAWVLPEHIAIARSHAVFLTGAITDNEILRRFDRFARSLVWSAARIADPRTQTMPLNEQKGVFHEMVNSGLSAIRSAGEPAGEARSIV